MQMASIETGSVRFQLVRGRVGRRTVKPRGAENIPGPAGRIARYGPRGRDLNKASKLHEKSCDP
jgi:hypothetical protein